MKNPRLIELDVLRFFAIVLVLFNHLLITNDIVVLDVLQRGGWLGVDLFFVLSGFLITNLLIGEYVSTGAVNIKLFLIRRGFKIYPSFWFFIISILIIHTILSAKIKITSVIAELLFIQNYSPGLAPHTWSLAIEEHFYFIIAFLFFLVSLNRFKLKWFVLMYVIVAALCLALRCVNVATSTVYSFRLFYALTHLRIDSLFLGSALAYVYVFHFERVKSILIQYRYVIILLSMLFLTLPFVFERSENYWLASLPLLLIQLSCGFILINSVVIRYPENWGLKKMAEIGKYSYSIYLWHYSANMFSKWLCDKYVDSSIHLITYIACYFFLAFTIGIILSKLIEYPMLKLRDKLFPGNKTIKL